MIEAWVYIAFVAPAVVIVLTIVFVRMSRTDAAKIITLRKQADELHRLSLMARMKPSYGQSSGQFDISEPGSEAYRRAIARSKTTY